MSIFSGITSGVNSDYTGNIANTTVSLNMAIIDGCVRDNTPVLTPYGFHSLPPDNFTAVQAGSPNYVSSVVIGYVNPCSEVAELEADEETITVKSTQSNVKNLEYGETEIFNAFNYALRLEKDKVNVKWKSLETRINNGENVMNLFLEIYAQMDQLINLMDGFWVLYNAHVHDTLPHTHTDSVGGACSSTPLTTEVTASTVSYVVNAPAGSLSRPQPFFTTIKNEMNVSGSYTGENIHIDDNGIKYSAYIPET